MSGGQKSEVRWVLRLYVAGTAPEGQRALARAKAICEKYLKGRYSLEVIDVLEQPSLAEAYQIFALPALARQLPPPVRKVIGDLTDEERVLAGLGILSDD
jgi:circadian clock protein KaiB